MAARKYSDNPISKQELLTSFRMIVESANDAIITIDEKGRVIF